MNQRASFLAIAIAMAGCASLAAADQPDAVLQTTIVTPSAITECPPPGVAGSDACDALNRMVRDHFTGREIGILFGTGTQVPDYRNVGFERLRQRYLALVQRYVAQQNAQAKSLAGH